MPSGLPVDVSMTICPGRSEAWFAWREAATGDYAGYQVSDFTFPDDEDEEEEEEETETTPVAAKPEPTAANVALPKQQTEIVEKEELPDAAPALDHRIRRGAIVGLWVLTVLWLVAVSLTLDAITAAWEAQKMLRLVQSPCEKP